MGSAVGVEVEAEAVASADGRRLRSERSRNAVIRALLGLYDDGQIRPSVAQIASASGVSERSVFRHFTDLEDLASAALERQFAEVRPFFADPPADGSLADRIAALVAQRVRLHARMANLARAAEYHAVSSPTIAGAVAERRAMLRAQVARQFAPELEAHGRRDRRLLLAALDQAVGLEALHYLTVDSGAGLSARDLTVVLTATLTHLLSAASEPAVVSVAQRQQPQQVRGARRGGAGSTNEGSS